MVGILSFVREIEVSGCDESPSDTTPPLWLGVLPVQTCLPNAENDSGNDTSEPVPGSVLLSQFASLLLFVSGEKKMKKKKKRKQRWNSPVAVARPYEGVRRASSH